MKGNKQRWMKGFVFCLLLLLPYAGFSQNILELFPYRRETVFFDFHFKRKSPKIPEIARFADSFIKLVNRDFLKFDFDYPIRVLVLEDRAKFREFLVQELRIDDPPNFGIYMPASKLFATYEDSGIGTFTHEILHPLVETNLKDRPLWAKEGIPTFFEKFYGYWNGDNLIIFWGFQNPWRIEQIGTNLNKLDLEKIISDPETSSQFSAVERNESDLRMASVFLWKQGRFNRFLRLIAAHEKARYSSYFEAAMQMPIKQILPAWQSYLEDVSQHRSEILSLPPSTICSDHATFQKFATDHRISVSQPRQEN
jgi:hypothetical protein